MDVFIESQPAVRHMDLLTHNHMAKMPGNTPPAPWMSAMMAGAGPAPKESEKEEREGKDFITLALKDELGRPIVGLKVLIETPAKRTFQRPSPAGGEITLRGLKKGSCQVTLLDWQGKPMKEMKPKVFAPDQDGAAVSLPTGKKHELTCQIATMTVEFAHPRPGGQTYPKLVLESSDGKYKQQRSAKNDLRREKRQCQVRFDYLPKGAHFTLTRFDGPQLSHVVFKDAAFDKIVDRADGEKD